MFSHVWMTVESCMKLLLCFWRNAWYRFISILFPVAPVKGNQMLSTKMLQEKEKMARIRPSSGGLNAVPMTTTEKADCKKRLTPQQIHQMLIGLSDFWKTFYFIKVHLVAVILKRLFLTVQQYFAYFCHFFPPNSGVLGFFLSLSFVSPVYTGHHFHVDEIL